MAATATYVSIYVKKELNRVEKGEHFFGSRGQIRERPPSLPASDPLDNDDIMSKAKKYGLVRRDKKNRKSRIRPRRVRKFRTAVHAWSIHTPF